MKSRVEMMSEIKLQNKLKKMNAGYHHHFHNAIVGHADPDMRYNAKWLETNPTMSNQFLMDEASVLQNKIGNVRAGAFRRGQGGLFSNLSVPFDALNANKLFIESEKRKKLL